MIKHMRNFFIHFSAGLLWGLMYYFAGALFWHGIIYTLVFSIYIEGMQWVNYDKESKLVDRALDILSYCLGTASAGVYFLI